MKATPRFGAITVFPARDRSPFELDSLIIDDGPRKMQQPTNYRGRPLLYHYALKNAESTLFAWEPDPGPTAAVPHGVSENRGLAIENLDTEGFFEEQTRAVALLMR